MSAFRKGYRSKWYRPSALSQAGSQRISACRLWDVETHGPRHSGHVLYGSREPADNCAIDLPSFVGAVHAVAAAMPRKSATVCRRHGYNVRAVAERALRALDGGDTAAALAALRLIA